jgi:putative ABC transport system substrate-binding protein
MAVRGLLEAFRQGLKEYGWVEGQNIIVEYRFAEGKEDALPAIAAELARSRLDVIVAEGTAAIQAAKTVT